HGPRLVHSFRSEWRQATVVPGYPHWWHVAARGEIEMDNTRLGVRLSVTLARTRFHAHWGLELQYPKDSVETIAAHISESTTPEVRTTGPKQRAGSRGGGAPRDRNRAKNSNPDSLAPDRPSRAAQGLEAKKGGSTSSAPAVPDQ